MDSFEASAKSGAGTEEPRMSAEQSTNQSIPSRDEAEQAVRTLISFIGEDPSREGLIDTPDRVVRAWEDFFYGYKEDLSLIHI